MNNIDINKIEDCLRGHVPVYPEKTLPETSAVLIPLILHDGELSLLYEQRAKKLDSQPGEICFPGGRQEKGETLERTAVRETCEELLVDKEQVQILGPMNGIMGPSGAPVWPYVGVLENYGDTWSTDEVERTFYVPLRWFVENPPRIYQTKMITVPGDDFPYDLIPGGKKYHWREKKHSVYFYQTPEAVIWGLTGHITASFVEMLQEKKI